MPIFTAIIAGIAGLSAFIGTLGPVGAFLLKAAVGVGLSLAAQALSGKPKSAKAQPFNINGDIQGGGALPRSFLMGYYSTAGSLVWANTWGKDSGTPNAWLTQVIALSDMPVKGLLGVWVDGVKVTYDPAHNNDTEFGYSIPQYVKSGANLYIKFYDGTQTSYDPATVNHASSVDRPYNGDRIGTGVAYVVVHARSTKGVFSGFPAFKFEVDGMRLYDPTKDSTVGGTGSQSYSDPSTWGGDGDYLPAVQIYNLLRGIRYNTKWVYGLQAMTTARLPAANWIAAINKCRTVIASASGDVPQYRSGGEISVDQPITAAMDALLTACQGSISEIGGVYRMFLGEPGSPTISFTDDDILSTEDESFTPFFGLANSINGITASYPEPTSGWQTQTAPPYYRPDLESLDGGRRLLADTPFNLVPYAEQVQRLMKSALLAALRARRHTFVLPPSFWPYAVPGEVMSYTSVRNGYVGKLFRIDGVSDRGNLDVMVDLTEVDPSDYDWHSDTEFHPPTDGAVGPIIPSAQPIVDWFAEPYTLVDNGGAARRPAIRITWDNTTDRLIGVIGVAWQVRDSATLAVVFTGRTDQPEVGAAILSQGLLPNNLYAVRGQYIAQDADRETDWSDWLQVLTPDVRLTDADIYLPGVVDQLEQFVGDATEWIRDGTRQQILDAQRIARLTVDQDMGDYTDRQLLRREVVSTAGSIRAAYTEEIIAATGPTSALSARIETVEAIIPSLATASSVSLLSAQVTTIDGKVTAQASAITSLSAGTTDGNVATANFRMTATAGPAGYASRIGFEARAGGSGSYRSASMFLDVPSDTSQPTRVAFVADQFSVTNGSATQTPLIFQSGVLTLAVANIGAVTAGTISSSNGKIVIDLNNANIVISD
jgi:hypothetical protein